MKDTALIALQKFLARDIEESYIRHGFRAVVAGGAPREWWQDRPARDIDVYFKIESQREKEAILDLAKQFGEPEKKGQKYDGLPETLDVWHLVTEWGQEVELIFIKVEPEEYVKDVFHMSFSKIMYKHGEFEYDWEFSLSMKRKALVLTGDNPIHNNKHWEILGRVGYRGWLIFTNWGHALSTGMFLNRDHREGFLNAMDVVNPAAEIAMPVEQIPDPFVDLEDF